MKRKRTKRVMLIALMMIMAFMLAAQPVAACCYSGSYCGGVSYGGCYYGSSFTCVPEPKEWVKPYVPTPYKLSVTYYPNGGTWLLTDTQQPSAAPAIPIEEYVSALDYSSIDLTVRPPCKIYHTDSNRYFTLKPPPGKQFKGWAISYPYFGTSYWATIGASIKTLQPRYNQYDLYAIWEDVYTVTYHPNGGAGQVIVENADGDNAIIVKDQRYTNEGFTFDGWNTDPAGRGTSYAIDQRVVLTSNITLYAQWKAIPLPKAKITYYPNGGVGTPVVVEVPINSYYTIESQNFTKDNATFNMWNTAADGSGTARPVGTIIYVTGDVDLYALWTSTVNYCSVTYLPGNGGTGSGKDEGLVVGSTYIFKNADGAGIVYPWANFIRWSTVPSGTGGTTYLPGQSITLTGDLTVYAIWWIDGR